MPGIAGAGSLATGGSSMSGILGTGSLSTATATDGTGAGYGSSSVGNAPSIRPTAPGTATGTGYAGASPAVPGVPGTGSVPGSPYGGDMVLGAGTIGSAVGSPPSIRPSAPGSTSDTGASYGASSATSSYGGGAGSPPSVQPSAPGSATGTGAGYGGGLAAPTGNAGGMVVGAGSTLIGGSSGSGVYGAGSLSAGGGSPPSIRPSAPGSAAGTGAGYGGGAGASTGGAALPQRVNVPGVIGAPTNAFMRMMAAIARARDTPSTYSGVDRLDRVSTNSILSPLRCPDGAPPLVSPNGQATSCGAGFDGAPLCPKAHYCHIDLQQGIRLCCPLDSEAARLPPEPMMKPDLSQRPPNEGEVIDDPSLPGDVKAPKLTPEREEAQKATGEEQGSRGLIRLNMSDGPKGPDGLVLPVQSVDSVSSDNAQTSRGGVYGLGSLPSGQMLSASNVAPVHMGPGMMTEVVRAPRPGDNYTPPDPRYASAPLGTPTQAAAPLETAPQNNAYTGTASTQMKPAPAGSVIGTGTQHAEQGTPSMLHFPFIFSFRNALCPFRFKANRIITRIPLQHEQQ